MKLLLLALPLLALISCAPGVKPDLPILPIPKTTEVAPQVAKIRPALDLASDSSAALKAANASLARQAATAKQQADDVSKEASRLAQAGSATSAELLKQATDNAMLAARVGQLESEIGRMTGILTEQAKALADARTATADAQSAASAGDAAQSNLVEQVKSLTVQYRDVTGTRDKFRDTATALQTKLTAEEEKSSKWFKIAMGLAAALVGWIVLKVLVFAGKLSWRLP